MNYYKITFKQLPSIVFAHKYETADYDMHFPKSPENRAEISYIDKGTLYFSNGKIMREVTSHTHSDYLYCTKARKYISEHIYEKLYVEDIAESLSLSRGHLSRIFKDVTSHTLIDYINKTKIDAACEILNSVGGTSADLSALLSVNDEKYLCRLFKKYKGLNIKEYKKLISSK